MHGLTGDFRAAARGLRRAPAFTAAGVITLAVAIAVNTALFSFVNAIYFRPLPYGDAQRLYHVRLEAEGSGRFEAPRVGAVRESLDAVAEMGAYRELGVIVSDAAGGAATPLMATAVDGAVLALIGSRPVAGRLFGAAELSSGSAAVVIVDASLATARFGGPEAAVGGVVRVDGMARTVVGVLPDGLAFPDFARLWIPLENADLLPFDGDLEILARLSAAVAPAVVERRLEALSTGEAGRARVRPLQPQMRAEVTAMLGAIGFLLLIACANVANLVLARGTARRHELGVRSVLGASRGRLLRSLLAEGLVLAGVAALFGGLLGAWLTDAVVGLIPADQLPLWFHAAVDVRVLAWIAAGAVLVTLVVSGVPALALTRGGLSTLIAAAGTRISDARAGRLRTVLVASQLALATMLLAGAGLLARSFVETRRADPGYAATRVLQVGLRRPATPDAERLLLDAVRDLETLPGAGSVAARMPARVGGRVRAPNGTSSAATLEAVTPAFFDVLGLSVPIGRTFTEAEAATGGFALISASLADALFGSAGAALGGVVSLDGAPPLTVVGVTGTRRDWLAGGLDGGRPARHLYLPPSLGTASTAELLIRADGTDPLALAAPAVERLRGEADDVVVGLPRTLADVERERATDLRVFASLFGGFGLLALALAALGIYGVVAYSVSRRTREIGVRVALGATSGRVAGLIARGVLPPIATGLAAGTAGAFAIARVLRGTLFGVASGDPVLLLIVAGLFAGTAMLAAWLPARRAARIDPLSALRIE